MQGRGIPLRGLRIELRQFILTHVVNFWPKYSIITWVNPSGEYSLLGSDSLLGQTDSKTEWSKNGTIWKRIYVTKALGIIEKVKQTSRRFPVPRLPYLAVN